MAGAEVAGAEVAGAAELTGPSQRLGLSSPAGSAGRRLRRALAVVIVVLALLAAASARLFVWPASGMPAKVNAIVMLAGPGNLLPSAVDLARQHRAQYLVVSLGTPQSGNPCPAAIHGVKIICFNPVPASTQGEAEFVGRLAKRYHWRSVSVVTITSQDTRARLRVERCFAGQVYVVTVPPDPAYTNWPYQIAYQWAALIKALALQRSC